jgi:hypothetical protein
MMKIHGRIFACDSNCLVKILIIWIGALEILSGLMVVVK